MSLLTIITDAADECGIIRPATVISSTDPSIQRLLRLANKVGRRLNKITPSGWQITRKEVTYTSVATEEQTSILPEDFDRLVPESFWDRSDRYLISGPISATEWQNNKAHSYTDTYHPKFAIRGDAFLVIPTLQAGHDLAFEYVSNQWCQSAASAGQTVWTADDDTGILDEELMTLGVIWEYLNAEGLPANSAAVAYGDYFNTLFDNDQPGVDILTAGDIFGGGRHFGGAPYSNGAGNGLFAGL